MTISQMPTTSASVSIEWNGSAHDHEAGDQADDAEEDVPAAPGQGRITDRRNRCGNTAEDEADADPDGQQQHRIAEVPEASTASTSEAAPLMNSRTRPPAETCRLNANTTWLMPVISR